MDKQIQIERAIQAIGTYQGQQATLSLIAEGRGIHSCTGTLTVGDNGWISVDSCRTSWSEGLAFDPLRVQHLNVTFGTDKLRIEVQMLSPQVAGRKAGVPAIVPSSSGA